MSFRERPRVVQRYFEANHVNGSIHRYVAQNRKMYYAEAGDSRPTVVFVHGSPGSLSAFLPYLTDTSLLQRARLISVDRPGFGYSTFGYGEPSLDKQALILKELLIQKKQNEPVILAGHSLAGPLVVKMAAQYPDLIDGVVIIAGSVDPDLEPNEAWFRAPLATPFLSWLMPRAWRSSNVELYHLKPQLKTMIPEWSIVQCPVVVIHGKKDQFVPFENIYFAERMLRHVPVKYMLDDDANHFIPWTRPGLVKDGIHYLLDTLILRKELIPVTTAPDTTAVENHH